MSPHKTITTMSPPTAAQQLDSFLCITTTHQSDPHGRSKIKASHKREHDKTYKVIINKDYELDTLENHYAAAQALVESPPFASMLFKGERWVFNSVGHDLDHYFFFVRVEHPGIDLEASQKRETP